MRILNLETARENVIYASHDSPLLLHPHTFIIGITCTTLRYIMCVYKLVGMYIIIHNIDFSVCVFLSVFDNKLPGNAMTAVSHLVYE